MPSRSNVSNIIVWIVKEEIEGSFGLLYTHQYVIHIAVISELDLQDCTATETGICVFYHFKKYYLDLKAFHLAVNLFSLIVCIYLLFALFHDCTIKIVYFLHFMVEFLWCFMMCLLLGCQLSFDSNLQRKTDLNICTYIKLYSKYLASTS